MSDSSIKRTLVIRCGVGVGLLLCILSTGIYLTVRHGLFRELDRSIEQTAALLADQVELEDGEIHFEWQEGMGTNKTTFDSGLFQFWDESTGFTTRSPGLQSMNLPKFCGENGKPLIKDIELPDHEGRARAIGMRIFPFILPEERERMKERGRVLDSRNIPLIFVVARDTRPVQNILARMRWILASGTLVTICVVFILINRAIGISLKPIDLLTDQVMDREGRHLDSPLELPHTLPTELTGLTNSFNSLLSRLAQTRQRENDFIRHATHELRTPIAGLLATTDLALSQPRENSSYQDHLENCRMTAMELSTLVQRLSALARSDSGTTATSNGPIDLAMLISGRISSFKQTIQQQGLVVRESYDTHCVVSADLTLVTIIINNLLDNIVCYAVPDSEIAVTVTNSGDRTELVVSNEAGGLPEDLERLFEPLFRHDAARSDSTAHLGIGLTLSRNAANSMGASLSARRTTTRRIEFVLSFPRTAA